MADFDWKSLVRTVAPIAASAFGTPVAGMAVSALVNALLPSGAPQPADPEKYLQQTLATATPEQLLAIKKADQDFAVKMKELDIDLDKINAEREKVEEEDRNSARQREMAVKDSTPARLAYALIGGFVGLSIGEITAMMVYPEQMTKIPEAAWLAIGNISGYLANEAKQAAAYYFGSSKGSQQKDEYLYKSTPANGK